ncbi:hypothetical protein KAFR_0J02900 [Kazachstania africana CBS 2517]|uniref:Decapping nuclease n=1 Tax=Kazachstania africana (strain ATCC 22294 / BCRC 22015 / CBS 2517 / CECT 1963 / NBRC 1671 / NRRL Y-8276) TaxID=1071382 RepID=H2B154_KAZAF|nr:hypothetical protein KAFR_0J02900 [Kazachstania africana CBS 2517]CCF60354.1 hypothetical protein KAFR_0J02900 [Kazachstania africana CBS 2517]
MTITSNLFVNQKGSTTSLKQPKEIGYYSRTQNNEFLVSNDINLKYYYLPDAALDNNLDLSSGVKKFKDVESGFDDPHSLHGLLEVMKSHESSKSKKLKVDIVSTRSVITKLISAAFDNVNINPINMRIVSFDDQLFIKELPVAKSKGTSDSSGITVDQYSKFKFHSLATISQPLALVSRETLEKRTKKISNNGDQFVSAVRTGVGSSKLLLGSEIDCIFDFKTDGKDNLKHYTKLACTSTINSSSETLKFENNIFRTWLSCFVVGIQRVIYGFKDKNSILKTVEEFATDEIPVILKQNNSKVSAKCLDAIKWYGLFTEWLLKMIPRDDTKSVRPFKLILENNHLKLIEIEQNDSEYNGLVEGEAILSNTFREWRNSFTGNE